MRKQVILYIPLRKNLVIQHVRSIPRGLEKLPGKPKNVEAIVLFILVYHTTQRSF